MLDSHMHIWDRSSNESFVAEDLYPRLLGRQFLVSDYEGVRRDIGIDQAVLVHGPATLRHTWACLHFSDLYPELFPVVVGWLDLHERASLEVLDDLRQRPAFRGLRSVDWFTATASGSGPSSVSDQIFHHLAANNLTLDVLVSPANLHWVRYLSASHPRLRIVVDNMGLPGWRGSPVELWKQELEETARHPNVSIKLAGLFESAGRVLNPEEVVDRVRTVISVFGPERVMYATNWPVVQGVSSAHEWQDAVVQSFDQLRLTDEDRSLVFQDSARRFYSDGHRPFRV